MVLMLGLLSVAIWLGLLLGRGAFWCADQRLPDAPAPGRWPVVAAVIPARDEAASIGAVLAAHAATAYPGRFSVTLVDDGSSDGTRFIAERASEGAERPIRVVSGEPLPPRWSGKLWALEQGVRAVLAAEPEVEYFLLTDADIEHAPQTLSRLVALAEAHELAQVSLMARLDARGFWGGLLVPAFVFFFQKLYPFPLVNDRNSAVAGAAGGCILIRRAALADIGGIGALMDALIDDCTLASLVKRGARRKAIWLGLADTEVVSLRDNRALGAIWKMVTRTAFVQLHKSWALLAGATVGMALTYLAGPLLVLLVPMHGSAPAAALGVLAWALSAIAYLPTLRLYGGDEVRAFALPAVACVYMLMTLDSARAHAMGQGGAWKGRTYSH
ncbi:glycosyltransferase [Limibaculum sp. M0105]|uniref:Glycosyltransferase n=1 Tax=Thermohalobaculum xanthum TaxID=2753746 RepID=A0A8J7M422_9RHOB|nr:glycosyltransferase [Thermohalobaculum xanthum]MBK0397740.1 glycosyltransferase [Thermohalobaculum xanthum]